MRRSALLLAFVSILLGACASAPTRPTEAEVASLAPTGKLRVGLYTGNPLQLVRDPKSQEARGAAHDLARELARRTGVAFQPVVYPSVGAMLGGLARSEWDIAVLVVSPERVKDVDFADPLVEIELGYLVPKGSRFMTAADIDQPGVRVAAPGKGQAEVLLRKLLKSATVLPAPGVAALGESLKAGKADAAAANKPILYEIAAQLDGSRVLDGRFSAERAGFVVPKGRPVGLAYVNRFVAEAKAAGLVDAALRRADARGAVVAP